MSAQSVFGLGIYLGDQALTPSEKNLSVAVYLEPASENLVASVPDSGQVLPWYFEHNIPGRDFEYRIAICWGADSMEIYLQTWLVDWPHPGFFIPFQSGIWCLDMKDVPPEQRGMLTVVDPAWLRAAEDGPCRRKRD